MTTQNIELRIAIQAAYKALNESDKALKAIFSLVKFEEFDKDDLPIISFTSNYEIMFDYHEKILYVEDALRLMELRGFITLDDFI
jgi:hypothetical protein